MPSFIDIYRFERSVHSFAEIVSISYEALLREWDGVVFSELSFSSLKDLVAILQDFYDLYQHEKCLTLILYFSGMLDQAKVALGERELSATEGVDDYKK